MRVEDLPVIRVHTAEYDQIPRGELYMHFNLAPAFHEAAVLYSLPRIIRRGLWKAGEETPPELDHRDCLVARCVQFTPRIGYEELTSDRLAHSMFDLREVNALKERILERYQPCRPAMTPEAMLSLGVSATLLRFEMLSAG